MSQPALASADTTSSVLPAMSQVAEEGAAGAAIRAAGQGSDRLMTYRGMIYPWQCDHIGHMNVMWYVGKFDEATWNLFTEIGLTPSYLREADRGMVAVEQNLSYRQELLAGDTVRIHSDVLEVGRKTVRFRHTMTTIETGACAALCEITGVHLDRTARKSVPFPDALATRLQALIVPDATGGSGDAQGAQS